MNIDAYLKTLPDNIMSGEDVVLPDPAIRQMLDFAGLRDGERFCHLGCGSGYALRVAAERGASVGGVDSDPLRVAEARRMLGPHTDVRVGDVTECDIPAADVILFWFADPAITHIMPERFSKMPDGTPNRNHLGAAPRLPTSCSPLSVHTEQGAPLSSP